MENTREDLTAWATRVERAHKRAQKKGGKRRGLSGADVWEARQQRREKARLREARRA